MTDSSTKFEMQLSYTTNGFAYVEVMDDPSPRWFVLHVESNNRQKFLHMTIEKDDLPKLINILTKAKKLIDEQRANV